VKSKVYIESTVPGYLVNRVSKDLIVAARQQITQEWWVKSLSKYDPYISQVVIKEISDGDPDAAQLRLKVIEKFPLLESTPEVVKLAKAYFKAMNIPETALADAYHLALSAWHGIDFLLTWNFKHIANASIRRSIDSVSAKFGIVGPMICTPEEL
jgi:hypothetical protein